MKKTIENIGNFVIDKFFDFDNNDYTLENGCYEPENGVYDKPSLSISIIREYHGHDVTCSVRVVGGKLDYVEVLFESDGYSNIEPAVNEFVKANLDARDLYESAIEDYRDATMDEYQRNGFANAADYQRYRYGRVA